MAYVTPSTRLEAVQRLDAITAELVDSHRELGQVLAVEAEAKTLGYAHSDGADGVRRNAGAIAGLESTKASHQLKGDIAALTEERDHLRLLLAYGVLPTGPVAEVP